jgi:hypothetical protein
MSNTLILGAAALVCSIATAPAADLIAPVDGGSSPSSGPAFYAAPPVYAAPLFTAPQVYVVPAPLYTAPVVTAPIVTAPVVTAPPVVSHPIYAYAWMALNTSNYARCSKLARSLANPRFVGRHEQRRLRQWPRPLLNAVQGGQSHQSNGSARCRSGRWPHWIKIKNPAAPA